jgi:triphosphoribosyl-dephospho-CoA synthetase
VTIAAAFLQACLEELAAPKPGNVHIHAPGHRMTVEDFVRSAEVSAPLLCRPGAPLGRRILDAATATREAVGQNTNLGILLLCAPLAMAAERHSDRRVRGARTCSQSSWPGLSGPPVAAGAATGGPDKPGHDGEREPGHDGEREPRHDEGGEPGHDGERVPGHDGEARPGRDQTGEPGYDNETTAPRLTRAGAIDAIIAASGLADADAVFAAIRLANPAGLGSAERHDVRQPAAVTLPEAMAEAAGRDSIARQWSNGFADIFGLGVTTYDAARSAGADGPGASLAVYLAFLSSFPDSHVARKHGTAVAVEIQREAARVAADIAGPADRLPKLLAWDTQLKSAGINPGTSADLTVATAFAWRLDLRSATGDG